MVGTEMVRIVRNDEHKYPLDDPVAKVMPSPTLRISIICMHTNIPLCTSNLYPLIFYTPPPPSCDQGQGGLWEETCGCLAPW